VEGSDLPGGHMPRSAFGEGAADGPGTAAAGDAAVVAQTPGFARSVKKDTHHRRQPEAGDYTDKQIGGQHVRFPCNVPIKRPERAKVPAQRRAGRISRRNKG
jgi:hypothetical protein